MTARKAHSVEGLGVPATVRVSCRRQPRGTRARFSWLRTGCQRDAIPAEFGSRSTCYQRFVEWTKAGVFQMMHIEMLR
jgi:transposase